MLVLVDSDLETLRIETVSFEKFDAFKYRDYNKEGCILIGCSNSKISKAIKSSIEAICSNDINMHSRVKLYNYSSIEKIKELLSIFEKHLNSITILNFDSIKNYEHEKNNFLYFQLNFYKVFKEVDSLLQEAIDSGAEFKRASKKEVKSIIYNRQIKVLDEIKFNWVYNENGNIIIDFAGLLEWKDLGVMPELRRYVEIKYFL